MFGRGSARRSRLGIVRRGPARRSRRGMERYVAVSWVSVSRGMAVVASCVGIGRDRASCGRAVGARSGLVGFGELGHGGHG